MTVMQKLFNHDNMEPERVSMAQTKVVNFLTHIDFKPASDKIIGDLTREMSHYLLDSSLQNKGIEREDLIDITIRDLIYHIPVGKLMEHKKYVRRWINKFVDFYLKVYQ